jgi:TRAP-type C4-dicarboxylate transport system permease small subunit
MVQRTIRFFKALSLWVDRLTYFVAVPLGIFFVGIVFANVLARYVFSTPIIGAVEYGRIAFVWATFLGAAMAVRRRSHIRFEFLADLLPHRARLALEVLLRFLILAFLVFVLYQGFRLTGRVQRTFFPASGLSQVYLYLPLPIGAGIMLIHSFAHLLEDLQRLFSKRPAESLTSSAIDTPEGIHSNAGQS